MINPTVDEERKGVKTCRHGIIAIKCIIVVNCSVENGDATQEGQCIFGPL